MRLSANRIRSLATRYALAEAAAFPGLRTEPNTFATNRKPAPDFKHGRLRFAHSPEEPQPRRCFDGPVNAPGRHFFSPANSHPAGMPQI